MSASQVTGSTTEGAGDSGWARLDRVLSESDVDGRRHLHAPVHLHPALRDETFSGTPRGHSGICKRLGEANGLGRRWRPRSAGLHIEKTREAVRGNAVCQSQREGDMRLIRISFAKTNIYGCGGAAFSTGVLLTNQRKGGVRPQREQQNESRRCPLQPHATSQRTGGPPAAFSPFCCWLRPPRWVCPPRLRRLGRLSRGQFGALGDRSFLPRGTTPRAHG